MKDEKLLYAVVHHFRRRFGGRFEEYLGEAYIHYHHANETHEPTKGKLSKRISAVVWCGLVKHLFPAKHVREVSVGLPEDCTYPRDDDWEELSEDSREVLGLVLEGGKRTRWKLMNTLIKRGWSGCRIMRCFEEIREALL